jgi:hypothetical protein
VNGRVICQFEFNAMRGRRADQSKDSIMQSYFCTPEAAHSMCILDSSGCSHQRLATAGDLVLFVRRGVACMLSAKTREFKRLPGFFFKSFGFHLPPLYGGYSTWTINTHISSIGSASTINYTSLLTAQSLPSAPGACE